MVDYNYNFSLPCFRDTVFPFSKSVYITRVTCLGYQICEVCSTVTALCTCMQIMCILCRKLKEHDKRRFHCYSYYSLESIECTNLNHTFSQGILQQDLYCSKFNHHRKQPMRHIIITPHSAHGQL